MKTFSIGLFSRIFLLFLVLSIISSCSGLFKWARNQPPAAIPVSEKKPKLVRKKHTIQKENLDFAFAGGQRAIEQPEEQPTDTVIIVPKRPKKIVKKSNSKTSSRFQAMIEKARKLRAAKAQKENALYSRKEKPDPPVQTIEPQQNEIEKAEKPKIVNSYEKLIDVLKTGEEPVKIVIGRGKKYWVGSIASRLFPYGSAEYNKMLDWIVANNRHYNKPTDLNMVRVGDELTFPAKSMVLQQLATNH